MRKGVLALESEEIDANPEDAELAALDPTDSDVVASGDEADAVTEVRESETDLVEASDTADEGVDVAERVEAVGEKVEATLGEDGEGPGMDENTADALDTALEGLMIVVGAQGPAAKIFPAMEGFKEAGDRKASTKLALEAINDRVKKIWAGILATIERIIASVTAFFTSVMNGTKHLEVRAKMIKAAALKKKGGKAGGDVSGKKLGAILIGGKVPYTGNALRAALDKLHNDPIITHDYGKAVTEVNAQIAALVEAMKKGEDDGVAGAIQKANDAVKGAMPPDNHALPLGDATLVVSAGEKGSALSVSIKRGNASAPDTVPALSPEEAAAVADSVLKNLSKFAEYAKQGGNIEAGFKTLIAKVKSAQPGEGGEKAKAAHEIIRLVNSLKNSVVRASAVARSYELQTLKTALDFAGDSVKAAAKGEAAAAAPAAAAAAA